MTACRLAALCLLGCWLLGAGAVLAAPPASLLSELEAPPPSPTVQEQARALAEILGDEPARAALIERLLQLADEGAAAATVAAGTSGEAAAAPGDTPLIEL